MQGYKEEKKTFNFFMGDTFAKHWDSRYRLNKKDVINKLYVLKKKCIYAVFSEEVLLYSTLKVRRMKR